MEIEYTKPASSKMKRKNSAIREVLDNPIFQTPLKKTKLNNSQESKHLLSNAEKSFIYLHNNILDTEPKRIAQTLDRDKRTVEGFIESVNSTGSFSGSHKKKGRWRKGEGKLQDAHKRLLRKWIEAQEVSSVRSAWLRLCKVRRLRKVSYNPVKTYISTLGGFIKPCLKSEVSDVNKRLRLKYCRRFLNYSFNKVLFTDESIFQLNSNNTKLFHFKGEKPPKAVKLNPNSKIMIWAGVSYYGKTSLHFITQKMKADGYLRLLKQHRREMKGIFTGRGPWRFLHDGAPPHRPPFVKNYIERWLADRIQPHPPQSPDLNAIELVWAQMKTLVEKERPKNKQQLKEALLESWEQITLTDIRKCIGALSKKMHKIIELNGDLC